MKAAVNLETALSLAQKGAFVFPCQADGEAKKAPCKNVYWRSASTSDEAKINQLWNIHRGAMPGIDVGKSGWLVVDCDMKRSDGIAWFVAFALNHGDDLSSVPQVQTPSGGRHYIFKNPKKLGNGRGSLPPKSEADVDIRGHGGYVIGPGSVHLSEDGEYKLLSGDLANAPDVPEWLEQILTSQQTAPQPLALVRIQPDELSQDRMHAYGVEALEQEVRELAGKQPGERNEEANRIAFRMGQLVGGKCLSYQEAYNSLAQAALSWGIRPNDKALGPRGTLARAIRAGEASPRGPQEDDVPTVEIMLDHDPETGEVLPLTTTESQSELPAELTTVPGLVGEIARWITDTALYPQPALALGAALTLVATAAGRHMAGPNRCGTHLFVVGLAKSGGGKNHPLSQISVILSACDMRAHIGPSQFISMPAVINFLVRMPLSLCAMDEFGAFLKRINNRRASGFEGAISGVLRSAWGASFSAMSTPEWAQRSSEIIFSPALSIYGVSTAREFYDSLEGADVTNGVLNRFLVIESKVRPKERAPLKDANEVPQSIVRGMKAIYNRNPIVTAQLCQSRQSPPFYQVPITPDAEQIRRGLVEEINSKSDADSSLEPFMARTAENALRLATIVAIGCNPTFPEIDAAMMSWARAFATWCTERLAEGAGLYIADSDTQAVANAIRRAIHSGGGRISRQALIRLLQHRYKSREIEDVIKMMAEAEHIVVETIATTGPGRPPRFYSLPTLQ